MTDDFQDIACPTPAGIEASLKLLRKADEPFSEANLVDRRDLLFLPFLRDITTLEQRASRLKAALELATDRLPNRAYEVVYRVIFLEPDGKLSDRRNAALAELAQLFPEKQDNESPAAKGIEERLVPKLAGILLDPAFALELDDADPKPKQIGAVGAMSAFRVVTSNLSFEIDNDDHRKSVVQRKTQLECRLPDQRIAVLRFNSKISNPMPVEDSVEMQSAGHAYLGSFPDSKHGAVADWILHLIYLGARLDPGDIAEIEMREEYFDEGRSERHPCVTYTLDHDPLNKASMALRLPKGKLQTAKPERQIIATPHSNAVVVHRKALPIGKDGWVRTEFTDLKVGFQYGIYLPNFDLYR